MKIPGTFKYGRLKQTHPRVDQQRLRILHAMYRGGQHLLGDDAVMREVFPRHAHEQDMTYSERRRRAFYENLFALVVNFISAGLAQDPVRLAMDEKDPPPPNTPTKLPKPGEVPQPKPPKPVPKLSPEEQYWVDLLENASPPGLHEQQPLDHVIRAWCVEALVCGWAWLHCDMPPAATAATSLADQVNSGALNAYPCLWPTNCVVDWSEKDGQLQWLRTYECVVPDDDPTKPRSLTIHRWTLWTDEGYFVYDVEEDKTPGVNKALPRDEEDISFKPELSGTHSFGQVPWVLLDFCKIGKPYLHVGDLIESLCRNYFNRSNGESFQWISTYFQQLYEFLGPEMPGVDTPVSDAQANPGRATNTPRGPNITQVRGQQDTAKYIAPDMSGADIGHQAIGDMRDAILRSTGHMALSQDTSGAMVRRSADSKKQDAVAQEILLGAIGKRVLIGAHCVMSMLAHGRKLNEEPPKLQGYQRFSIQDLDELINQAVLVDSMSIPSSRYQIERRIRLIRTDLGDDVPESVMSEIRQQLEQAMPQEQYLIPHVIPEPEGDEGDKSEEKKPPFGKGASA